MIKINLIESILQSEQNEEAAPPSASPERQPSSDREKIHEFRPIMKAIKDEIRKPLQ